ACGHGGRAGRRPTRPPPRTTGALPRPTRRGPPRSAPPRRPAPRGRAPEPPPRDAVTDEVALEVDVGPEIIVQRHRPEHHGIGGESSGDEGPGITGTHPPGGRL